MISLCLTLTIDFDYEPEYIDTPTTPPSFTDVPADAYYSDAVSWAVSWAVSNGITNGNGPNSFGPAADCSRGQIVTFLFRHMAE